jgi:Anthranilate/para-aminobenzoate synthases component I
MSLMLIGYFGYDIIRFVEKIPNRTKNDLKIPDVRLQRPRKIIIHDNLKKNFFTLLVIIVQKKILKIFIINAK